MLNDSSEIEKGTATFADNVLTIAGGTTLALGVSVLASPITSRLFGPEAFGLAALFQSGAAMLAAIACLRYEMAIVLPKKDEDAAPLFALCCIQYFFYHIPGQADKSSALSFYTISRV